MKSSHPAPLWRLLAINTAVALAALSLVASPATADKPAATKLEKVRAYVQPSVVYLGITWTGYVYDDFNEKYLNDGEPFEATFQCTGYVVNPNGYIATAGHCVNAGAEVKSTLTGIGAEWALNNGYYTNKDLTAQDVVGDYRAVNKDGESKLESEQFAGWGVAAGGAKSGQSYAARVVDSQAFDKGDAALLKVEAKDLQAIKLAGTEPEVGQDIVSIGYPASVDKVADLTYAPSFKDGSVSSKKSTSGGLFNAYEISAAMSGGMSGGPTVNLDHQVIGFNSFNINGETQQFNFVRPSTLTKELMSGAGVKNTLGTVGKNYNQGLDAYFDGDRDQAVESLQKVLDEQPSNELAQEFIKKAKKLEDNGGTLPIVLIALAVLAAAGGGAAVLMRRTRKAAGGAQSVALTATPQAALAQSAPATPEPPSTAPAAATAIIEPVDATDAVPGGKPKFCPSCGDPVQEGEKFCSNCGTPLTSD